MKKQKFSQLNLDSIQVLSKEQQKKIAGGGGYYQCYGWSGQGCPAVSPNPVPGCDCRWLSF